MPYETINKPADALKIRPNLHDYESQRASFSWDELARELDGLPGPSTGSGPSTGLGRAGLNIAYEALDRHVAHGKGDKPAILWEGKNGEQEDTDQSEGGEEERPSSPGFANDDLWFCVSKVFRHEFNYILRSSKGFRQETGLARSCLRKVLQLQEQFDF